MVMYRLRDKDVIVLLFTLFHHKIAFRNTLFFRELIKYTLTYLKEKYLRDYLHIEIRNVV